MYTYSSAMFAASSIEAFVLIGKVMDPKLLHKGPGVIIDQSALLN